MSYTWAEFEAAVTGFLTDRKPTNEMFVLAVAEYVRARIQLYQRNDRDSYTLMERRYTTLRKALAGYETTANDATLRSDVRTQLSSGPRTNAEFARAVAHYVRAEIASEIDARDPEAAAGATATAALARANYERMRIQLAGYAHTLGSALATEVAKYLPNDSTRANTATFVTASIANAVEQLQAFGTWLDGQIDAAKRDIQSMNERVRKEIRAGVIDLQRKIRAYTIGHQDIFTAGDVVADGYASIGMIEDGQIRSASILINRSATPDVEVSQGTFTPTAGVVSSLEDDELRVYSVLVVPHEDNVSAVLIGYDTDNPTTDAPLSLPQLRGTIYDLSKVVVKTATAGDKVKFLAVLAPEEDDNRELRCADIAWDDRRQLMVTTDTCAAQIAVNPKGDEFVVTPALQGDEIALRLEWDGTKLDFEADDEVPFDEDAAEAVGMFVNAKLAMEWGESIAQVSLHQGAYNQRRTSLYLKHRARGEVRS